MPESHLRAADSDRTAVASVLGEHMAAGRLTVDEYEERLTRAYAAKTYGELDELTTDLPSAAPTPRPEPRPAQPAGCSPAGRHGSGGGSYAWQAWLRTSLIVLTIWAVTCLASWEFLYFWPVWVIGPWGAVLLAQTLTRRGDGQERRRLT